MKERVIQIVSAILVLIGVLYFDNRWFELLAWFSGIPMLYLGDFLWDFCEQEKAKWQSS